MRLSALIANVLVLSVLGWTCFLAVGDSPAYSRLVQEDQLVQWTTYAAFLTAAMFHWSECLLRQEQSKAFWFLTLVGLFCLVVAGEEISWGQRILGFQAPEYFLAHNFEHEFNLHNVIGRDWQAVALVVLIVGYGMLLPLLVEAEPGAGLAQRAEG